MRSFFLLVALGFSVLGSMQAPMQAIDLYGNSPTAQAAAMAGISPVSESGPTDALAANPATLRTLTGPLLELSGVGVFAQGHFHNSTASEGVLSGTSGISGAAAFGMPLGQSRVSLGFGVFPVSLLSDKWRYFDPPGGAGGTSYGYQTSKSALLALQASTGVAVQARPWLALGASLGVVYNANTLETPYVFQVNPVLKGLKTLLDLHTNGVGYNGTFGVLVTPHRRLDLSLTYKTRTTVRSTGIASGNAANQFTTLGIPFQPAFRYQAEVDNVFPQSASANFGYQIAPRWRTRFEADWTNWHNAFVNLPVHLTRGNNADINGLLGSSSLDDSVPLAWKNQLAWRAGVEFSLTEHAKLLDGYAHMNDPVPARTLTPLTAAIMTDTVSTGLDYRRSRYNLQLAYQVNLPSSASVQNSQLLSGEYSSTRTSLWLQTVVLTTGIRF